MLNNWQEVFEAIRDEMPVNTPYTWDEVCERFFGLSVPEEKSGAEWIAHIHIRNEYKIHVNRYCAKYRENWRLYCFMKRVSLIKFEKSDMLNNETQDRLRYVAGSLSRVKTKLRPMAQADGMSAKDRRLIEQMIDVANGANMAVAGMVQNISALSKHQKAELIEQFGISQALSD